MSTHALTVAPERAGTRLDLFVGEALSLSRAQLKRLFEEDRVRVNGRKAKKGQPVQAGQQISVEPLDTHVEAVADATIPLVVLHEDDALIVVDKPGGTPSHPLRPGELGTVANAVIARYPECAEASEDPREGGLCHRLDVETSGALLIARDRETWKVMREAFGQRRVDKKYWALTTGPIADEGEIQLPLRHSRSGERVEPAVDGVDAREALSEFKVLERKGEYSLVEVTILTGVLHQVRAHLAAIGAPILGDPTYGGRPAPELGRFFLHARSLSFDHPKSALRVHVESPLPPELEKVRGECFRR